MFNKVVLIGNLTRDVELRRAQSGTAIAKTAIATSHKFTQNGEKREETCFIDITFFGNSGEIANRYLKKGSKVLVEGRLHFEQWDDKETGARRSKHYVIVETMRMLDSKQDVTKQDTREQEQQHVYKHTDYQPLRQDERAQKYNEPSLFGIDEEIPF